MHIICVVDDAAQHSSPFRAEHGLAFLVETENGRMLFDTGQNGTVLLHNLDLLDVDAATIDALAISHAHNDHSGGLPALLEQLRPGTPLYANPDLFRERFSRRGGVPKRVGLPLERSTLADRLTLHLHGAPREILPGVWTTGEITHRPEPQGSSDAHLVREGDGFVADPYRDDMALVLQTGAGLVLLCGCCHAGLLNTLSHVERTFRMPVVTIAGGLHLMNATAHDLQQAVEVLAGMSELQHIYPNHCTGKAALVSLTQRLGPSVVQPCPAGTELAA